MRGTAEVGREMKAWSSVIEGLWVICNSECLKLQLVSPALSTRRITLTVFADTMGSPTVLLDRLHFICRTHRPGSVFLHNSIRMKGRGPC